MCGNDNCGANSITIFIIEKHVGSIVKGNEVVKFEKVAGRPLLMSDITTEPKWELLWQDSHLLA